MPLLPHRVDTVSIGAFVNGSRLFQENCGNAFPTYDGSSQLVASLESNREEFPAQVLT